MTGLAVTSDAKWMAVGSNYYIDIFKNDGGWALLSMATQDGYNAISDFAFSRDE